MGSTQSKHSRARRQPAFLPPLPAQAPFQPARNTAERTLKAQAGWETKRANLKREWSSHTGWSNGMSDSEIFEATGWCGDKRDVGAEGQFADDNCSTDDIWSVSDEGSDKALEAGMLRSES